MTAPWLTAIVTCLNEEQSIETFYGRLRAVLEATGRSFEIVVVNDGSRDRTWELLRGIHARDEHVTVVDLYKNAGQGCAVSAALEHAEGEHYLFIDSDLQLDPEDLPTLLAEFDQGQDFVSGYRRVRHDPFARRLPSWLANRLMRHVAQTNALTDFGCTFKLIRGSLVRGHQFGPRRMFNPVYLARTAERIKEVPVEHHPRTFNRSGWNFRKLWAYMLENVVGATPQLFQYLSAVAFFITALVIVRVAVAFRLPDFSVMGEPISTGFLLNALLMATAFLLGVLCMVGEYSIRSFLRDHMGPLYIVRELHRKRVPQSAETSTATEDAPESGSGRLPQGSSANARTS